LPQEKSNSSTAAKPFPNLLEGSVAAVVSPPARTFAAHLWGQSIPLLEGYSEEPPFDRVEIILQRLVKLVAGASGGSVSVKAGKLAKENDSVGSNTGFGSD
jgi:hypothetical protein